MEDNIPSRPPPPEVHVPIQDDDVGDESVRTNGRVPGQGTTLQEPMSQLNMATVEKLTGSENYSVWKFQMSIMFRTCKMMKIVNGT
jgi:hypothetical protein